MRDQRSRDLLEEPGEVYQTGVKPGAVTLTQHLPVQRKAKAKTDARAAAAAPSVESYGFIQAYGGELQMKGSAAFPDERPTPWMAAEQGTSGSAGQLPYLDKIQASFGRHDISSVRAYTDSNATAGASAMGAEAYAVGDQVAFGAAPTLHTAAHEAAHVVQQRAGVSLKGGVGEAGDPYERHADAVADKVVRGESAESLLDEMAGGGGGGGKAIQRVEAAGTADDAEEEAPATVENPQAILAAALDSGHDPDRSSGDVDGEGAGPGDAAATAAPAGAAPVQKKAAAKQQQMSAPNRAIQMKSSGAKTIVKDYVVSKDAARAVPDTGSEVYKASQDLSRATCGSDGDPPGMVDIGSGRKIHKDVQTPLANLIAASGGKVKIKDALRSLPQQWDIWKRLGLYGYNGGNAAIPGTSNHGTGRAVDLSGDMGWVAEHAGEHGFVNFSGEDWHFDHLSSAGVRGRKFNAGTNRKRSGHGTSAITAEEAAKLQASYDAAIKAWDEGKTPGSGGTPVAPTAGATTSTTSTPTPTPTPTSAPTGAPTGAPTAAPTPASTPPPAASAAALTALIGKSVTDNGGFVFVLQSDLSFKITGAPPGHPKSLGKFIKKNDPKLAASWEALSTKLQQENPAPAVAAAEAVATPAPAAGGGGFFSSALSALTTVVNAVTNPIGTIGSLVANLADGLFGADKPEAETPPDAANMKEEPAAAPAAGGGAAAAPAAGGGGGTAAPAAGGKDGGGGAAGAAPGDSGATVSTPGAASGPIDPANHQSRASFKQANVPENATTTAILDSIWPHYNTADHVIGGYLSSGQQYWKINYHWELVLWVCDYAAPLAAEEHKASFTSIASTLRSNSPNPGSGYLADSNMTLVDTSTQEVFDARYLLVKQAKKDLKAALDASGVEAKSTGWKKDRCVLAVQNVLPPGDNNKHGQGFSLDIKGNNARISETSKSLGATTTYDEKFHVHVEFKSGVSTPASKPVQKKDAGEATENVHQAADAGTSGAAGRLPYADQIQASFGRHDVSNVRAYTDSNAAAGANAMGAEAYAVGDQVAFGGAPTLHTAAHEAAHVVQQRAGVSLKGGVGQAGDSYERHADAVADRVVRGESAESLLDQMAGTGGGPAVQRRGKNEQEHKDDVAKGTTAKVLNPGTLGTVEQRDHLRSADGMHEALELTYKNEKDQRTLELNEQFEIALQKHLEHGATPIAKAMSATIGGYQSFEGAQEFIAENLKDKAQDVDHKPDVPLGNEDDLLSALAQLFPKVVPKGAYTKGPSATLDAARAKVGFLKTYKGHVEGLPGSSQGIQPDKAEQAKKLFRKIFYTAKLDEMLQSQMGYFGGSLEFKAGLEHDLEYWVYLLSTKTRGPEQQLTDTAPKPMAPYKTDESRDLPYQNSLLPWNNQFSMSVGHAEFTKADSMPKKDRQEIEEKLDAFQQKPENLTRLNQLVGKDPPHGTWSLAELIDNLDENKRKTLYTDMLRLSWSTNDYDADEKNNFAHNENPFFKQMARYDLAPGDIKDPRIHEQAQQSGLKPQTELGISDTRAHVVGRKANILLTPESASFTFQKTLMNMSPEQLEKVYGDFVGAVTSDNKEAVVGQIVDDAESKVRDWYVQARLAKKPMYAGPSGHTLGYINLYREAYDRDERAGKTVEAEIGPKPNLEKARVVMLASLIGVKEHHTYDEVMVASQGIHSAANPGAGNDLAYIFRSSYGDMVHSHTGGMTEAAAKAAKEDVKGSHSQKPEFSEAFASWYSTVLG